MNIIFLGPPGSGKGTQSQIIAKKYNLMKLSSGDLLREVAKTNTEIGIAIRKVLESGVLVSDEQIIDIIELRIQQDDCKTGFILDGFPRTIAQAKALNVMLQNLDYSIDHVIELAVSETLLIERICNRFNCNKCGASFNYKTKPTKQLGICDYCGGDEFSIRTDDTPKTFKDRLETYHKLTSPLKDFYREQNIFNSIDGMQDENIITEEILDILKQ